MIRTRRLRSTPTVTDDGHTVTVRLVGWDEPDTVSDDGGRTTYSESYARGGLTIPEEKLLGEVEHGGQLVARATSIEDRKDGLYAVTRVSQSTAGRDLVADIDAGLVEHVSIDFDDDPQPVPAGGSIVRSGAQLRRFAFTTDPQHTGARVVGRRSNNTGATMPKEKIKDEETEEVEEEVEEEETDEGEEGDGETTTTTTTSTGQRSNRRRQAPRPGGRRTARAGGRFRSFGHFAHAALHGDIEGDELRRYQRALDPATTADTPGLVHEEWIREIIDLQRSITPAIEEFSSRPLPESGDSVSQPRVKVRPLVGKQADENTQIASRAVEIEKVTWNLETFAGGQAMSLHTALRSSPEYLNEVMRLHLIEMNESKNAAVVTDLEGIDYAANGTKVDKTASYADGEFVDDLTDVCVGMLASLKRFPEVVLIATNVWGTLAKAKDGDGRPIYPSVSPMNPAGSLSLKSTNGMVLDLSYRVEPELTDNHIVVGIKDAYRTFSSGVQTLTADVPSTLGREVAVYSFAAMGVADERGLWEISPAA